MDIKNLKNLISISEAKKQLSNIVNGHSSKIIVKNNKPVSVIIPFEEYVNIYEKMETKQLLLNDVGEVITLESGVQVKTLIDILGNNIEVKLYKKMQTSEQFEIYHTFTISGPSIESTYTTEELIEKYTMEQ